ncbi:MAG: hypothetical protein JW855_02175 [Gammaproteobacteria bacterium]|nr:hypothetical protein [Gammaproteobacteria bacterium]
MKYNKTKEFDRDFKKLLKKFPSLVKDLEVTKRYRIELLHCKKIDNGSIFEICGVGNSEKLKFYKIKKFQCCSLKGRGAKSGIRIIYAFCPIVPEITFLEIYFKAKQEKENRKRLENFINSQS